LKYVLDTSIIISGRILEFIREEGIEEVIIPYIVISELENQANEGRSSGYKGLDEINRIKKICREKNILFTLYGERPTLSDIELAPRGRMDALIRDVARKENGVLLTMDYLQSLVGEIEGLDCYYVPQEKEEVTLSFKQFFSDDTMSIHLKEGVSPYAKKGEPGSFKLVKIRESVRTRKEIQKMIDEIHEVVDQGNALIEINKPHAKVVQLDQYRIAIAEPPFSDGLEITVVRPLIRLSLDDYRLSDKLKYRLGERAEGILIAGPPGSGKTTFASSLADYYSELGKVTKTIESPRDLMVVPEITQYGPLDGEFENTADILLLVRPDFTIFDEVRKGGDFEVFSDMRLAGVGMVGVVHAAGPLDALQRFLSRTELGMIPSIIDTIIFIKEGEIKTVYNVTMTVKVPTGMVGEDLSRPVVEIRDFETGELRFEIFTFGNESVIVPLEEVEESTSIQELAIDTIYHYIRRYDKGAEIEITGRDSALVKVDRNVIPRLIGKGGRNITKLEDKLGIHIDVEEK
jgi:ATPase